MLIKVKKPFEPNPSASHPKLTSPAVQVTEINPDEEKPVVEPTSKTSEDFHGGNELSFSLPNTSVSSPPMPTSSQSSTSSSSEQQLEPSSPSSASETPKTEASKQQQLQPESSSQQSSEEHLESSSPSSKTSATESPDQQSASEQQSITSSSSESSGQQQQLESSEQSSQTPEASSSSEAPTTASTTETSAQTSKSSISSEQPSASIAESKPSATEQQSTGLQSSEEQGNAEHEETGKGEGHQNEKENEEGRGSDVKSRENESDEKDEDSAKSVGNEDKNQAQPYVFNTQQAFAVDVVDDVVAKYYQTEFYRFIEMIAEEKTKFYDPYNAEEYNVKKLMFRQFERKPLSHYRMARVREAVVLLLDNSGSMTWWSTNIQMLARLAMQRNDVEAYLAPNGVIEEMIHPRRERVVHSEVMKRLRNRRIIYVGDFDGANTPIVLSWYNDVIWICPEKRYKHFREHDWVSYTEDKFKGAFLRVFTLEQMFKTFRKLLSSPSLKLWYDLFDEYVSQEGEDTS